MMLRRPGAVNSAAAAAGAENGKDSVGPSVGGEGGGGGDAGGSSAAASSSLRGSLSKFKKPLGGNKHPPPAAALAMLMPHKSKRNRRRMATTWVVGLLFVGLGPLVVKRVLEGRHFHPRHHPHEEHPENRIPNQKGVEKATGSKLKNSGAKVVADAVTENNAKRQQTTTTTVDSVRQEFYDRYGGVAKATNMYQRGIRPYGSIDATAERMLRSAASGKNFVLSFAGYSVTVGRGNHYEQSFPFVVERILRPLLQDALHLNVTVRNAAIGGIPSFPYGFCFEHFLGIDSDVISWDYSMNEGNGAAVLESYVRHAQAHLVETRPMMILLDTNPQRCQLLQSYADLGILRDALCVGKAKDAVDDLEAVTAKGGDPNTIPVGFQKWDEFGAPPSCPGRGSWHPKKQEHALIGWNIAMYFVAAAERAIEIAERLPDWKSVYGGSGDRTNAAAALLFPKPLSPVLPANDEAVTRLLYGHADGTGPGDATDQYVMHQVSCRTNFLPAMDRDKILPSVVVSGLAQGVSSEDILKERDDRHYRSGWVLDVSKVERDTKIKVDACGGLGYVDMKIALYGVPESGKLRLWLPVAAKVEGMSGFTAASDYVNELVICEANEKRPDKACHLDHDLVYTVGGVKVKSAAIIKGAAEYLKRSTCVHVGVPSQATVTPLDSVKDASNLPLSVDVQRRLENSHPSMNNASKMGLVVDIEVTGSVTRKDGACCISHIVWEHGT